MERVTGIGGLFFRAMEPERLAAWYEVHLGIDQVPKSYGGQVWRQRSGPTAFAPVPPDATPMQGWSVNFRVDDLDAMVAQLRAAGIEVDVDQEDYPNGRFASLHDPEGNAVQLWEPSEPG
ncbi:VOC family protein [Nonomuraea sp. NBC_01738]|uniref:VOC family protein n=1 Tax=Nonomuraea sp. NBC_01738 TaxID=2976003 RepID=UPI002E0DAFBF|nr:VOC family protein [Nonomuraea sp. NBC_01738]